MSNPEPEVAGCRLCGRFYEVVAGQSHQCRKSKFRNKGKRVDGVWFASGREYKRWCELKLMERNGDIRDFQFQKVFKIEVNGVWITSYRADSVYFDVKKNQVVVEDSKGFKTKDYEMKARLMKAVFGIEILET